MFSNGLYDGADITTQEARTFDSLYSVNGSPLSLFWACNKVSKTERKRSKTPLPGQKIFKVESNIQTGTEILQGTVLHPKSPFFI